MYLNMLKAKIHQATVTEANLYYVGSITIDANILQQAGILPNELVHVVNINNGSRIETYTIAGEAGSKVCCLNGAAARYFHKGDRIIIMSYCWITKTQVKNHRPNVVFLNEQNQICLQVDHETPHTEFKDQILVQG